MRSRISRGGSLAVLILALVCLRAQAADPLAAWPAQLPAGEKTLPLGEQIQALTASSKGLPDTLQPAVRFQSLFLEIIAGWKPSDWRDELVGLSRLQGDSPAAAGVREVARVWLARLQMSETDSVLRAWYRRHVRFPDALSEIENDLPENLRKDPWGDSWSYKPRTPQGFDKLSTQRYQLGPARFPDLDTLAGARIHRHPPGRAWTITLRQDAGKKALEFRSPGKNNPVSILDAGGKIDGCTVLYIGDGWALMSATDQLFAVLATMKPQ